MTCCYGKIIHVRPNSITLTWIIFPKISLSHVLFSTLKTNNDFNIYGNWNIYYRLWKHYENLKCH